MKDFLLKAFSEEDGSPSSARVLSAIAMLFTIIWSSAIIVTHLVRHFEPVLPDFSGLALLVGTPYAINKTTDIIGRFSTPSGTKG
jgi:hypothetical protein